MILLLALFAAFGLWRVTVVLRKGEADWSTGGVLVALGPLLALPLVLLAWLGGEPDIHVPMEQAVIAGGLGMVCVVLGVVMLAPGEKKAG